MGCLVEGYLNQAAQQALCTDVGTAEMKVEGASPGWAEGGSSAVALVESVWIKF